MIRVLETWEGGNMTTANKKIPMFIQGVVEKIPKDKCKDIPKYVHGIYCLLNKDDEIVYVGMARGKTAGIRSRLASHVKSKIGEWTHLSVFQIHNFINNDVIVELEGIFRHMYRFDKRLHLQKAKKYAPLTRITYKTIEDWRKARQHEPKARRRQKPPLETAGRGRT